MPKSINTTCLDPGFGYENGDGYVRIWNYPKGEDGARLVMRHRWFWELQVGEIPDGYEIDHVCKNRRCCNIEHFRCIPKSQHVVENNTSRYSRDYNNFAIDLLKYHYLQDLSQPKLAAKYSKSQSTICNWLKKFNKGEIYV